MTKDYKDLVRELFELLDKQEETDDGRVFHPNRISSCRVADTEKLNQILNQLRKLGGKEG